VLAALDAEAKSGSASTFARDAADSIRQKSPTSLKIAFRQLQLGRSLDFRAAMRIEFRIASHIVRGHDLYEGIRAVVVDKDNQPRWRPPSLAEVTQADVEAYFAPAAAERAQA
jgi:enoyl-CoA hydratase